MKRWAVLAVGLLAACRQSVEVDTSGAKFIPVPVAVDNLRQILPQVMVVSCTQPRATFEGGEIKEWKVDAAAVEFRAEGHPPFRLAFADITQTRVDRLFGGCQVRVFTPGGPKEGKEHYSFNFRDEGPARKTVELIDALRAKR